MKQAFIVFLAIAFAALLIVGCGNNNTKSGTDKNKTVFDLAATKEIIQEKNNKFTQAHITGDTAFLNNIFTKDGRSFVPNSDVVIGQNAIAALNLEYINFGIKEFREETKRLYGYESYLIDEGNYFMRYGKDNIFEKGKYLNVWKNVDGDWKIYANIWNTSMPIPPAK